MASVIISTHSEMALGVKKTVEYIMGKQDSLYAVPAYTEGAGPFLASIQEIIKNNSEDEIFLLTDIFGGSVNNELNKLVNKFSKIHLITGVNLPMVIQLLLSNEKSAEEQAHKAIIEAQSGIIYMNEKSSINESFDDF